MSGGGEMADAIVIGGGLVGAAIAWGLLDHGHSVIMLDEGDVALRASRGNFGLVWVQSKGDGMPEYARWTRGSADLWGAFGQRLTEETGISPHYEKPGGLYFMLSEEDDARIRDQHVRMHNVNGSAGYGAEMLDRRQLDEMMPGLGPDVISGSYCKHDGHANPLFLLRALHLGFARRGGRYHADAEVERVEKDGEGFCVTTARGRYRGGKVVMAAGHGNTRLGPMLGMDVPIHPEKGQILVTERAAPLLPLPTHVLRQTNEGTIMIGDSHEDTGYSTASTSPVMAQMAAYAVRCFPALAKLRVVRSWGAVRVLSKDGFPVYQQSAETPGAFAINCHSGVTLAAAHAGPLAAAIAGPGLGPEFDAFSPRRFLNG